MRLEAPPLGHVAREHPFVVITAPIGHFGLTGHQTSCQSSCNATTSGELCWFLLKRGKCICSLHCHYAQSLGRRILFWRLVSFSSHISRSAMSFPQCPSCFESSEWSGDEVCVRERFRPEGIQFWPRLDTSPVALFFKSQT